MNEFISHFSQDKDSDEIPNYHMELTKEQWERIKDKEIKFVSHDGHIALRIRNSDGTFRNTVAVTVAFI